MKELEGWSVVKSLEGDYSLWSTSRKIPWGWEEVGFSGTKDQCLQYIELNWKDMTLKELNPELK